MPSTHKTTSSKRVHRGSTKSSSSSHRSSHPSSKSTEREKPIERYVEEERDHRSYEVQEHDPYQEEARLRHEEALRRVVEMDYDFVETMDSR
jgi:hypothetical protein